MTLKTIKIMKKLIFLLLLALPFFGFSQAAYLMEFTNPNGSKVVFNLNDVRSCVAEGTGSYLFTRTGSGKTQVQENPSTIALNSCGNIVLFTVYLPANQYNTTKLMGVNPNYVVGVVSNTSGNGILKMINPTENFTTTSTYNDAVLELSVCVSGGGGSGSLTNTYVGFGDGLNQLDGEAGFTYDAESNRLAVDTVKTKRIASKLGSLEILNDTKFNDYSSGRNDSGKPTSVTTFGPNGELRRDGIWELRDSIFADFPSTAIRQTAGLDTKAKLAYIDDPSRDAVNTFINSMKFTGLWDSCMSIHVFTGTGASTNSVNIKSPTQYRATWVGNPTFGGGVDFSAGQYGYIQIYNDRPESGVTMYSNESLAATNGFYLSSNPVGGTQPQTKSWGLGFRSGGFFGCVAGGDTTALFGNSNGGMYTVQRNVNGSYSYSQNGTVLSTTASGQALNYPNWNLDHYLYINRQTGGVSASTAKIQFIATHVPLSASAQATFYSLVQALQTSLGRQIGTGVLFPTAPLSIDATTTNLELSNIGTPAFTAKDGIMTAVKNDTIFYVGGWLLTGRAVSQVWYSVDNGKTFALLTTAPFNGCHNVPFVQSGSYWYLLGSDNAINDNTGIANTGQATVWRTSDFRNWTQMTADGGWGPRIIHAGWAYNGDLYIAGGHMPSDLVTAKTDVWKSSDDGATWTQITTSGFPAIGNCAGGYKTFNGKMMQIEGGIYLTGATNKVYSSTNGIVWKMEGVLPSSGSQYGTSCVSNGKLFYFSGNDATLSYRRFFVLNGARWEHLNVKGLQDTHSFAMAGTSAGIVINPGVSSNQFTYFLSDFSGENSPLASESSATASSDPLPVGGDLSGTTANAQIVAGAVGATELASNAVTTAKILNGAVTLDKVPANGLDLTKINPATFTEGLYLKKSSGVWAGASANNVFSDVTSLTPNYILYGGGSGGVNQSDALQFNGSVFTLKRYFFQDCNSAQLYEQRKLSGVDVFFAGIGSQLGDGANDWSHYVYGNNAFNLHTNNVRRFRVEGNGSVKMYSLVAKGAGHTHDVSRNPSTGELASSLHVAEKYPMKIQVVDGNTDVPGAGMQKNEVIRIPAAYNGYSISDVSYGVRTTGATGTMECQIRKNGSGTAGVTFAAGQGVEDVTLTGLTVATGDIIDVEIISNSMATPQQGLWVTIFLTPN